MVVPAYLFAGDRFAVHGPPCVPDIGCDERDQQRDDAHHFEREFARRRVVNRQRRLHLRQRRVVGRVRSIRRTAAGPVPSVTVPAPPNQTALRFPRQPDRCSTAPIPRRSAALRPRRAFRACCAGIYTVRPKCGLRHRPPSRRKRAARRERQEEDEERAASVSMRLRARAKSVSSAMLFMKYWQASIRRGTSRPAPAPRCACTPSASSTVPRRGPLRDDRCAAAAGAVGQVEAVHREVCTREECPDGRAQQQGPAMPLIVRKTSNVFSPKTLPALRRNS